MKIVINSRYGGFVLSNEGEREWLLRSETVLDINDFWYSSMIPRDDPFLVGMVEWVVENMGLYDGDPWGMRDCRVVEIPEGVQWYISEYDGLEHVAEGRTWHA